MTKTILFLIALICLIPRAEAQEIPFTDKNCIRAAIGEAAGEGYHGLLAVSVAIRNKGSLRGVYGVNSPIVDKQPQWVWQMAKKAWAESKHNRIHSGSFWESTDFPVPYWADKMKEVYHYKKHKFYKETR